MNYYLFNRQEILQKAKEKYSKEKATEYYKQNKEAIKEKSKESYKTLSQEQKDKIKEYQKKYQGLAQYKKEALKINSFCFFINIKMSKKALKFNDIILNKKEPIDLFSLNVDQIVVSDKFKHNNKVFNHFIGYQKGKIVKPLCIILPQLSGYIKFENFENGGKNVSFLLKMMKYGINIIKFGK